MKCPCHFQETQSHKFPGLLALKNLPVPSSMVFPENVCPLRTIDLFFSQVLYLQLCHVNEILRFGNFERASAKQHNAFAIHPNCCICHGFFFPLIAKLHYTVWAAAQSVYSFTPRGDWNFLSMEQLGTKLLEASLDKLLCEQKFLFL